MPEGTRIGTSAVPIYGIIAGTVSITAPNALAADSEGNVDVTIQGLRAGDQVHLMEPEGLELGLVVKEKAITADNTLRVVFHNTRAVAGPATSARTYPFLWIDVTAVGE